MYPVFSQVLVERKSVSSHSPSLFFFCSFPAAIYLSFLLFLHNNLLMIIKSSSYVKDNSCVQTIIVQNTSSSSSYYHPHSFYHPHHIRIKESGEKDWSIQTPTTPNFLSQAKSVYLTWVAICYVNRYTHFKKLNPSFFKSYSFKIPILNLLEKR